MAVKIQFRRGTASEWTAANPVLDEGELGIETDTSKFKIGNGSTQWNSLAYGGIEGSNTGLFLNPILRSTEERWSVSATAATGTVAIDVLTANAWAYTIDATGNWTINFRGNSTTSLNSILEVGDSVTVAFSVKMGTTGYRATSHQIDGASVTPLWQGGLAPSSSAITSGTDLYLYTILKLTSTPTYQVYASVTGFA